MRYSAMKIVSTVANNDTEIIVQSQTNSPILTSNKHETVRDNVKVRYEIMSKCSYFYHCCSQLVTVVTDHTCYLPWMFLANEFVTCVTLHSWLSVSASYTHGTATNSLVVRLWQVSSYSFINSNKELQCIQCFLFETDGISCSFSHHRDDKRLSKLYPKESPTRWWFRFPIWIFLHPNTVGVLCSNVEQVKNICKGHRLFVRQQRYSRSNLSRTSTPLLVWL